MKPWHAPSMVAELTKQLTDLGSDTISRLDFNSFVLNLLEEWGYLDPTRCLDEFQLGVDVEFRQRPYFILLGGTSGCGKSTLGALLASRLGITTVLSTDHVRQLLRNYVSAQQEPALWASSYHANGADVVDSESVWEGFEKQSSLVSDKLMDMMRLFHTRRESVIVEGVHLSVSVMQKLHAAFSSCCIPFMVFISNSSKHAERFAIRAKYMTLEPRLNKYVKYFDNIRVIQSRLCSEADLLFVPKVDNTNVDRSLAFIHQTLFEYLFATRDHMETRNDFSILLEQYNAVLDAYNYSSKDMVARILENKRDKDTVTLMYAGEQVELQDDDTRRMDEDLLMQIEAYGSIGSLGS